MSMIDRVLKAVLGLFEKRVETQTYEALNRGTARGMARFIAEQTGGEIDPATIIDVEAIPAIDHDEKVSIEAEETADYDFDGMTRKQLIEVISREELEIDHKHADYRKVDELREAVASCFE